MILTSVPVGVAGVAKATERPPWLLDQIDTHGGHHPLGGDLLLNFVKQLLVVIVGLVVDEVSNLFVIMTGPTRDAQVRCLVVGGLALPRKRRQHRLLIVLFIN
jgi:hypothetical protein